MSSDHLTPQQELFAQKCVELVNQSAAYRAAYNVGPDAKWTSVSSEGSRIAALPHVAARIRELQDEAARLSAIPSLAARIQELREIETANPNEIIGYRWVNCRYCHGEDHEFQWAEWEYAHACDDAIKRKLPAVPDCSGGFGWHQFKDPSPDCPRCFGAGDKIPWVADTTKLMGGARRLYKGCKIKGNGDIEILLHDQMQARDMLNRIMGAYKDGANNLPQAPVGVAQTVSQAKTPEQRRQAYLRVVSGS